MLAVCDAWVSPNKLIAAIGTLAEDDSETSLWDIEDADFLAALDRFAGDIAKRQVRTSEPAVPPVAAPSRLLLRRSHRCRGR